MLFSIIVPVYNVEKYLDECLQSILCQINEKEQDSEIILIDDGSTDRSGVICDEYKKRYPDLIKVYHNQNQGLLLTRRYGYGCARGEYIINCDSDDRLERDMLDKIKRIIKKYNSPDIVLFNFYILYDERKENAYTNIFTTESDCHVSKEDLLKEFMLRHSVVSVCGKICRHSCIDLKRDYTSLSMVSNGEDTLQSIEFFNNAKTFAYLNEALYDYRMGSGMTKKFDPNYYFGFKTVLKCLKMHKTVWNIPKFDGLFAIKVLQTVGRAITQSRYNNWESKKEQKEYLKRIAEDEMLQESLHALKDVKIYLQKDHAILLKMLSLKMYFLIIIALDIKNKVEKRKNTK